MARVLVLVPKRTRTFSQLNSQVHRSNRTRATGGVPDPTCNTPSRAYPHLDFPGTSTVPAMKRSLPFTCEHTTGSTLQLLLREPSISPLLATRVGR